MNRTCLAAALSALMLTAASPLTAQNLELPQYTAEQRWQRLGYEMAGWQAAMVALGESQGMTAEEVGAWVGDFFSSSWLSGAEASQLTVGMNRNFMAMPDATVEVLETTPTSVKARFNHPIDPYLGPGGRILGVDGDDIATMLRAVDDAIAEWVGVDLDRQMEEGHDVLTLATRYGPIQASNDLRWERSAYLSWLTSLQLMSLRMKGGMSARELGAADAELYASTWTADTPWKLFRGMVWNQMSDPGSDCDVLGASPDEVRARCRRHYQQVVEQNQSRFGVTMDDIFESNRAFAEGVADYLGLVWTESLVDGFRMITVTRK
jgi:hypothetical protein